jgi:peptidoglycan hydrolase CwlO-like protein
MNLRTILAALILMMTMFSCGGITPEQITQMEDQREAALKAEETLQKNNTELDKLKREVEQAKSKKEAAEAELNRVKQRAEAKKNEMTEKSEN